MTHEICPVCNDGLVKKEVLAEDYRLIEKMDSMSIKVPRIEQYCDRCGTTLMPPALIALNVDAKKAARAILEEYYGIRKVNMNTKT